ncbi:MAG: CBS domain-containing protein [Bradyrhizobium sp.]|nr:MAG: CBS domain-containing protein [Bradyrhizobium sp.]
MKNASSSAKADRLVVTPNPETASDIMTTDIVSVSVGACVRDVALLLLEKRISAVPVLGADEQVVGMVSEGDLLGRNDADRVARRDWWLTLLGGRQPPAEPLEALIARPVEQVMSAPVMTIEAGARLHEIAEALRVYDIKRLPVMRAGRIAGIVSRSDLVRAMAIMVPQPTKGGTLGGFAAMLAGMMKTGVRLSDAPASAPSTEAPVVATTAITAEAFLGLVATSKQAARDQAVAAKEQIKLDHERRVKAMLGEHVGTPAWTALLKRARAAASLGENSFELIRFPCDLCSDGGRKIDVAEIDWPTTLRGEAAEFYTRWRRDLRAAGFGLSAQIIEYIDGIPGNVALSLTWRE